MSIQLNDIEKRLQALIEVHLVKYLPKPGTQDRIAQRIADVLKANLATQSLGMADKTLPNDFILLINPASLDNWQKDPRLVDGLIKVIRLVASEMNLQFKEPPSMKIATDPSIPLDGLDLRVNQAPPIAETQAMVETPEEVPIKAAFLIVGGTNVYTLDQPVTNIGRRLDNNLIVDDPRVSRYHAQIRFVRNRFLIFDLNSTGGTFVNGQRTTQSVLYPGDVISLAGLPIVFGQDNPPGAISRGDTAPLTRTSPNQNTLTREQIPPKKNNPS